MGFINQLTTGGPTLQVYDLLGDAGCDVGFLKS
jgi:hypothetical protein